MIKTEILIIGGGPAGATLAKLLSKNGVDNILIQRNLNFKKPCGGGLRVDAFDEFNLDKSLIQNYIDKISLIGANKKIVVDIAKNPIAIVNREIFDKYLRDEAKKAGTIIYEAVFKDVEIFKDYVITTIKIDNELKQIKSKYLVAADGVNSKVRKKIYNENVSSILTNYVDLDELKTTECEFHFGANIASNYYAWAFPEAGGTNIGTLATKDKPYIQNFLKNFNISKTYKIKGYKIPEFDNPVFYKDRTFFVGDSASEVLPFTYEGIYYAMASAKILANTISSNSNPTEYQKEWQREYLYKFNTLKKLQKIFLYNDLTIKIMMKMFQSKTVQKQMIELWLGKKDLKIDLNFFIKVFKKVVFK